MTEHPLRIRLHRGRRTHAARIVNGGEGDVTFTACGHIATTGDTYLDGNPPVDCRECGTALRRATFIDQITHVGSSE